MLASVEEIPCEPIASCAEGDARDMAYRVAGVLHRIGNGTNPSVITRLLREDEARVWEGIWHGEDMDMIYVEPQTAGEPIVWLV